MGFRLVLDQRLQLMECPFVQSASHLFACAYPFSNVGQIFHYDRSYLGLKSLLNNVFAHDVVRMLDTARFLARDFLQQLFGRLRTVGLQLAPFRQKLMSIVADLASAIEFTAACSSENIFTKVHAHDAGLLVGGRVGQIQDQIQVPTALLKKKLGFLVDSLGKIGLLKQTHLHFNTNAPLQGIQRKRCPLNRVGPFIKMDASILVELDDWYRLTLQNALGFVRLTDRKNGVTNHLGAQRTRGSYLGVAQVMEGNSVPTPIFDGKWNDLIASGLEGISQAGQQIRLLLSRLQLDANGSFHRAKNCANLLFYSQTKTRGQRFLSALKSRVSALSIG